MNIFETKNITIKWQTGEMTICLREFFPASNTRLKKLLDVVELDYKRRDELYTDLIEFCKYKVNCCEERRVEAGKTSLEYHQKVADAFAMIDSGKRPNGLPLKDIELKEIKKQHKQYKAVEASFLSDFKRYGKQKERFLKHIEMLEQRK